MTMTIDTVGNLTEQEAKKRFGLFPAKIGMSLLHKLGIAMPLEAPAYDARTPPNASKTRTSAPRGKPQFELGAVPNQAVHVPVKALAGTKVYLVVEPIDNLEASEQKAVRWVCTHPECVGKTFESKRHLIGEHLPRGMTNKLLEMEARRDPHGGKPHMYYGVLEVPAPKDGVPTIMLLSDEE